jgi:carboxyl-terminal processing protease
MNPSGRSEKVLSRRLTTILAVFLGLTFGVIFDRLASGTFDPFAASMNFGLLAEAWSTIERVYVDRAAVRPRAMTYGALEGMVDALGDTGHSRFLTPEMVRQVRQLEQNRFQGIGAEVRMKGGHIVIVAPIDGSPAMKAGLRPGDIILKVDGKNVAGVPLDKVVQEIQGPAGTEVTLTVLDAQSGRTRDVRLTRARITLHEVSWRRLPGTSLAQLHIASFNKGVSDDLRKVLTDICGDQLQGLILDLRNDPGGLLNEAVATASQFLSGGNALLVKNAQGVIKPIPVKSGGIATEIPMVVLVNAGSASASEIVAGALQDADRATLVGETTFGTGTVLREFDLSDGSALLLAVEEWLTPKGHVIWHKGITPGIVVALPPNAVPLFPESEENLTAAGLQESGDKQLLRGVELLTGR